ncbi:TIM-barrel domain-containing protein [Flagellimonas flava]|uniref:Alpha-glucosidase, glycosyl hydrolase family GH31 n=1 Tax=Flagellimonas flava TaxID=570519 RepID=A0A1M5NNR7_9FLAO|nr:TIM-barrel domain-containing protein [Allomuricauda flava]SHG91138.1 Alpha-glucosidase, glycosyl hydrolase family GH31 [Allomuricauda flava]
MKTLLYQLFLALFLIGCGSGGNNIRYDGYATKAYLGDSIEISFYSPKMFRFRISGLQGEKFPVQYEIPFLNGHKEPWKKVECTYEETEMNHILKTSGLTLLIDKKDLKWEIRDAADVHVYPSEGPIYGMFRDGYSKFDNASAFNEFNLNSRYSHWFYNKESNSYSDIFIKDSLIKDEYFIYGPDYQTIFSQFNDLVGPEPLLPKKGYGFFQTQHLSCSGNQNDFMEVAQMFRERDIPCDNLILDFGWGDACIGDKEITWGSSLDWSENYTHPLSANQMIDSLKKMNLDLMLIHHNAPNHPNRENHGWTESLFEEDLWWKRYKEKLDMGIAGTWQDTRRNNISDAEIWNGTQEYIGADKRVLFMGCRRMQETNPWGGEHTQLPVNAMIGQRRYPFRWVGDSDFTWSEMKWQINAITNTHGAMKGMSNLTWDVYGKTPLIQARMNQFVDFLSVSRSHNLKPWSVSSDINQWKERIVIERSLVTSKNQENSERLAKAGEYTAEKSIRRHRKLRYRLLPYIYSLAYENYLSGMPITRPMLLQYREDEKCNRNQWPYQYMFGSSLLVAPVYHDGLQHQIYLPKKSGWYDFWSKKKYEGGQIINYDSSNPDQLPLLIPEGATLVYGKNRNWIVPGEQEKVLWLEIYPGQKGETTIYEDDAQSIAYQEGEYGKTKVHWEMDPVSNNLKLTIGAIEGDFQNKLANRLWKIRVLDLDNKYRSASSKGTNLVFGVPSRIEATGLALNDAFKEVTLKTLTNEATVIVFK